MESSKPQNNVAQVTIGQLTGNDQLGLPPQWLVTNTSPSLHHTHPANTQTIHHKQQQTHPPVLTLDIG